MKTKADRQMPRKRYEITASVALSEVVAASSLKKPSLQHWHAPRLRASNAHSRGGAIDCSADGSASAAPGATTHRWARSSGAVPLRHSACEGRDRLDRIDVLLRGRVGLEARRARRLGEEDGVGVVLHEA